MSKCGTDPAGPQVPESTAYPFGGVAWYPVGSAPACHLSPDGRFLLTISDEFKLSLWDATELRHLSSFPESIRQPTGAAIGPEGTRVAIGHEDGSIRLYATTNWSEIAVIKGHIGLVHPLLFSPDGRFLATAGADRITRLWDLSSRTEWMASPIQHQQVRSLAFSRDSRLVGIGFADGMVEVRDASTRRVLGSVQAHKAQARDMVFFPGNTLMATTGWDGNVVLWELPGFRIVGRTGSRGDPLALTSDGKRLAAGGSGGLKLWNPLGQLELGELETGGVGAVQAAFLPEDETLVVAGVRAVTALRAPSLHEIDKQVASHARHERNK